ncbi:YjgN family protein [Ponticoccus litoralis]|uniref:DUF898 family protein n=1 Tax=Ponticoccus litoralis TaxID=422297 RepID=A0AAW9S9F1_9RHOB
MALRYTGEKGPLFGLTLKTGLLTVVTLGLYRFWAKTRIRKYIWSSVNAGGDTFEYTGTGLEKLLGFLVAIVFLAVYLGIVQMVLFYFGLNIMIDPETAEPAQVIGQISAIYISFFAVLPFLLYAVYRARRYKMARTRFRGIRLGMEKGAWGYVARALLYGVLSVISLGLLTPLMTFRLEKYMADRSFYGSARVHQNGRWTALYPAMKHLLIGIAILLVSAGLMVWGAVPSPGSYEPRSVIVIIGGGVGTFIGYLWLIIGSVYYGVRSFGYLMSHKTLGRRDRLRLGTARRGRGQDLHPRRPAALRAGLGRLRGGRRAGGGLHPAADGRGADDDDRAGPAGGPWLRGRAGGDAGALDDPDHPADPRPLHRHDPGAEPRGAEPHRPA